MINFPEKSILLERTGEILSISLIINGKVEKGAQYFSTDLITNDEFFKSGENEYTVEEFFGSEDEYVVHERDTFGELIDKIVSTCNFPPASEEPRQQYWPLTMEIFRTTLVYDETNRCYEVPEEKTFHIWNTEFDSMALLALIRDILPLFQSPETDLAKYKATLREMIMPGNRYRNGIMPEVLIAIQNSFERITPASTISDLEQGNKKLESIIKKLSNLYAPKKINFQEFSWAIYKNKPLQWKQDPNDPQYLVYQPAEDIDVNAITEIRNSLAFSLYEDKFQNEIKNDEGRLIEEAFAELVLGNEPNIIRCKQQHLEKIGAILERKITSLHSAPNSIWNENSPSQKCPAEDTGLANEDNNVKSTKLG